MESTLWSSICEKCITNTFHLFLFFCPTFFFAFTTSDPSWEAAAIGGGASYLLRDTLPTTEAHHVFTPHPLTPPHCQPLSFHPANFIDGAILHKTGGASIFSFFSLGWKQLSALIATPLFSPISPTAAVEASGECIIIKVEIADCPMKDWLKAACPAVRWTDWTSRDRWKRQRFFIIEYGDAI